MSGIGQGRRGFLKLLGAGSLIGAAACTGQEGHADSRARRFKGISRKGDPQEALREAIAAAQRSVRHPDALVEWKLVEITGRNGGFAGFNEVTAVIDAKV